MKAGRQGTRRGLSIVYPRCVSPPSTVTNMGDDWAKAAEDQETKDLVNKVRCEERTMFATGTRYI